MNIDQIRSSLIEERERISRAIDALSGLGTVDESPKLAAPKIRKKRVSMKVSMKCKHGCGKEFTGKVWKERHEADCVFVVKPNGSASVSRHMA